MEVFPRIGDKIQFKDEEGRGHLGRVYAVENDLIDYYCFDEVELDGCMFTDYKILEHEPEHFPFLETTPRRWFDTKDSFTT